jgi:hypothetical protein
MIKITAVPPAAWLGLLFIAGVLGAAAGWQLAASANYDLGYRAGLTAGRAAATSEISDRLSRSGFIPPSADSIPPTATQLSGLVVSVDGSTVTMETPNLNPNPLGEPTPPTRRVAIGAETLLQRSHELSPEELAAAFAAHQSAEQAYLAELARTDLVEPPIPPRPPATRITEPADSADIVPGLMVMVAAAADISAAEAFTATEFTIIDGPNIAAPTPAPEPAPAPGSEEAGE